jgi:hypothetical protein
LTTVTLRNAAGQEATQTVDHSGVIDAARRAKETQIAATGDKSWRVLKSIGPKEA